MDGSKLQQANRKIKKITFLGLWVNIALAALKLTMGFFTGSMALAADGIHSFSDMATDVAVLLGAHFSAKEPDSEHPYGHGRFETFATAFVGLALMAVGAGMIQQASLAIARVHGGLKPAFQVGPWVILVAVLSILAKELLYWMTRSVAIVTHSTALYANAWHHRSDALSSVAVFIGFIAMLFGYEHGDQIAAIAVGLMIILVGVKVIGGCFQELTERSADAKTMEQICQIIASEERIRNWHKLRTRTVGREIFLDLHILVDPDLSITEAHAIADNLERSLHDQMSRPLNIMVHIEPDIPELRSD
ncbi:MAG: cation transporter [Sedimentisphaerales bacterium]|nr:cation transporter [Sedimentisphaerales bacterium]